MRDKYWSMYTRIKHKERYYRHYSNRAKRISRVISGLCLIASAASIASWAIWETVPILWGAIVAAAQVVQTLSPNFPYSKQLVSLKFLSPRLEKLLIDIDITWCRLAIEGGENVDDEKFLEYIEQFERQFQNLTDQFIGDTEFPENNLCATKAHVDCNTFFSHEYEVKEDATNARQESTAKVKSKAYSKD